MITLLLIIIALALLPAAIMVVVVTSPYILLGALLLALVVGGMASQSGKPIGPLPAAGPTQEQQDARIASRLPAEIRSSGRPRGLGGRG